MSAAILIALALVAAPAAVAQEPAAISQYTAQQPTAGGGVAGTEGEQGSGGTQNDNGTEVAGAGGAAGTGAVSGDDATLPFTGYPLTNAVWIVLLLVTAGLLVRLGAVGYQRMRRAELNIS